MPGHPGIPPIRRSDMAIVTRAEGRAYLTPLIGFLLLFLGFPALVNLVYSVSTVGFQNLRSPELSGFGNYLAVVQDRTFWQATFFSFRFRSVGT